MSIKLISEQQIRDAQHRDRVARGEVPASERLRKGFVCEVKAAAGEDRALDFVISTEAVDRMGDVIAADGWKLESYRKNPVVLWAHDSAMMPVAKASNVRIEEGKLRARATFMDRTISGFADAVFNALKGGFLSATSVGFIPQKYAFVDDPERRYGIDFMEQELVEFSIVPVPANPEALIEARAAGIDLEPMLAWARGLLKSAAGDDDVELDRFMRAAKRIGFKAPMMDPADCPNADCPMKDGKKDSCDPQAAARARAKARLELARRAAA